MAGPLKKSKPEERAALIERATARGRANQIESAAFLGVHKYTIRAWWAQGKLRYFQLGGRKYSPIEELQRYLREGPRQPDSEDNGATPQLMAEPEAEAAETNTGPSTSQGPIVGTF